MLSRGKRLAHPGPTLRAILRRIGRIHLDHLTASALSLARKYLSELVPACVTDALCQPMVLDHALDVQIFNRYLVKFPNDLQSCLVVKVGSLPRYFQMLLC